MRSNSKKEDTTNVKKKYVFFSDPDVIVRRAETSAAAAQVKQDLEVQQRRNQGSKQLPEGKSSDAPIQFDLKGLENLLSYHPIRPYPFTFISAVKRKLALGDSSGTCKKAYDPNPRDRTDQPLTILKSNSAQNLYQVVQKMDFIRPLKVPDLKMTAKSLDFSTRENTMTTKFETSKEPAHERSDKLSKSFERVQRKLDFSTSDGSSIINSEIEPLKVPNISIASNLSKKKDHVRENSREKENRSKRIRKDDLFKQDEMAQDFFKRSRSPRHISRKEFGDSAGETTPIQKLKNERLSFYAPRESDFSSAKPRTKNFVTSTTKKDNDKRHRSNNARSLKSTRDNSVESKSRTCSNESLSERCTKLPEKIAVRESSRNLFESTEYRYKDDLHLLLQADDNRQSKQHKATSQSQGKAANTVFKEQAKRLTEKIKPASKAEAKTYIGSSKESEDIETQVDSNSSFQLIKNKDFEKSSKTTEDTQNYGKYADDSLQQSSGTSTKNNDESLTQSATTTTKQTSNNESSNLNESVFSDLLRDPRRISFRDENRSHQEEFCDLVSPDINLILRSKRKNKFANLQSNDSETDIRCQKYNPGKSMTEQESIPLLHPTALHLQFQAELHLLDSFNESLRQATDVEKCFYNVKRVQEKELSMQHPSQPNDELKSHFSKIADERNPVEADHTGETSKSQKHTVTTAEKSPASSEVHHTGHYASSQSKAAEEFDNNSRKISKPIVKAVEVQTQTVNDIATQTDIRCSQRDIQSSYPEICDVLYERGFAGDIEIPQLSLDSAEQFEDLDHIEEISLPSKLRTMSEISLHETTSSIRTETGTEISISTRDVTCSFNKYLDLEFAQLIKDEKQRYDKIEMLFKSREKTLNDRTKKLVKLEEQKRALRDTGGQDSQISSVKKKQRALLLKLQQEKDEMSRLKELHKIASQERKRMLQKQRNMFNPQMSTKNILTKLKRSADSQSPRRLSGPMKGYDIRSNSSMSSLVDSDKSQHDRSQHERSQHERSDPRLQITENDLLYPILDLQKAEKFASFIEESNTSLSRIDKSIEGAQGGGDASLENCVCKSPREGDRSKTKYEIKSRKFEEKMPRADILRLKSHQQSVESKLIPSPSMSLSGCQYAFEKDKSPDLSKLLQQNFDKSISEHVKSESDTLVEELSKKSKTSLATLESHYQSVASPRERDTISKSTATKTETIPEEMSSVNQDTVSKTSKLSPSCLSEDILQTHSKSSKKSSGKSIPTDKDVSKKTLYTSDSKSTSKRKSSKCQKSKSSSSILTENILRSKSNSQMSEELIKHHNKRTKVEKEFLHSDKNDENLTLDNTDPNDSQQSCSQTLARHSKSVKDKNSKLLSDVIIDRIESSSPSHGQGKAVQSFDDISAKPQVDTFALSRNSSGESDRNFSKSVVVRSQEHDVKTSKKLEQILNAREAALASRKNCVEEWMAWHAKLRAEEDHVARMEQATLKLVTATNVYSHQERSMCTFIDTTVSSDTSDIEGRIELLSEKLAERRIEMARLKKEARKQTKQKLRALEANLLNQIKKYDTTIHEMRKKLDSKKGITNGDKLAIESKSLADFKVPEIPLKRIHDLYKSSDLLRSRSESDLLSTKGQVKDTAKSVGSLRNEVLREKSIRDSLQRPNGSKGINASEGEHFVKLANTVNHIDENKFGSIEADRLGGGAASIPSLADDVRSNKHLSSVDKSTHNETRSKQTDASELEISEDIKTEVSISKSESIRSEMMEEGSNFDASRTVSKQSRRAKSVSTLESGIEEVPSAEYSDQSSAAKVQASSSGAANGIQGFSKKLDFLRSNNKNLNEDISCLENELKVLTEMISRFGTPTKGGDERTQDVGKTTAEFRMKDESRQETNSSISRYLASSPKLKSTEDPSEGKRVTKETDRVLSEILPQDDSTGSKSKSKSSHEIQIDYKARSKEILNGIEKSLISERNKITENNSNRSSILLAGSNFISHKENNELTEDAISVETEAKSMSEVYSKATLGEESISIADNASEAISVAEEETNIQEASIDSENSDGENKSIRKDKSSSSLAYIDQSSTGSQAIKSQSARIAVVKEISHILARKEASQKSWSTIESIESLEHSINIRNEETPESAIPTAQNYSSSKEHKEVSAERLKRREDARQDTFNSSISFAVDDTSRGRDEHNSESIDTGKISFDKDEWTISDLFDIENERNASTEDHQEPNFKSYSDHSSTALSDPKDASREVNKVQNVDENVSSDVEDVSMFIPKGESTSIEGYGLKFDEISESRVEKSNDELDDILDIIARDNGGAHIREESIESNDTDEFQKAIHDSVMKILDKVVKSVESTATKEKIEAFEFDEYENEIETAVDDKSISSGPSSKQKSQVEAETSENLARVDADPVVDIILRVEIKDDEPQEIVITELEASSGDEDLPKEIEIDAKVELADEEPTESTLSGKDNSGQFRFQVEGKSDLRVVEVEKFLEPIMEQDSSDGEQLDNLVEIAESGLDTIEKRIESPDSVSEPTTYECEDQLVGERQESKSDQEQVEGALTNEISKKTERNVANKIFDVIKDPEYEDISEESLEVSEILDKTESQKSVPSKKASSIPDKYPAVEKFEHVLRILDEIAQKSETDSESISESLRGKFQREKIVEGSSEKLQENSDSTTETTETTETTDTTVSLGLDEKSERVVSTVPEENRMIIRTNEEKDMDLLYGSREKTPEKLEQDASSESSEGGDTPKGVSELEMDSPRDSNDSRLDIDALNDDLLAGNNVENQSADSKGSFHASPVVGTSEKDIEVMIDKLKASLEQPGLEVGDLEAKLLSIEQLQIELEIKRLEAEEVTYYVREIPNKPPPPYTPPGGGGRISTSLGSPSPPPAVIPSNVEDLTAFTEKATALIFKAKEAGEDIMNLEAPPEIYELTKENDETVKKDRRIYNTFLFDLCKETIAEIYQAEYEKPGPSWTKPNVKTKPTMKIPKNVEELNDYVSKEVATLFGFKTKLQRENMVMRWSRKRRDRVDELLAREAQAEEDEWTKFHHDELAVKNGLTMAILDTLLLETVNVVKVAYAKKRKIMV